MRQSGTTSAFGKRPSLKFSRPKLGALPPASYSALSALRLTPPLCPPTPTVVPGSLGAALKSPTKLYKPAKRGPFKPTNALRRHVEQRLEFKDATNDGRHAEGTLMLPPSVSAFALSCVPVVPLRSTNPRPPLSLSLSLSSPPPNPSTQQQFQPPLFHRPPPAP